MQSACGCSHKYKYSLAPYRHWNQHPQSQSHTVSRWALQGPELTLALKEQKKQLLLKSHSAPSPIQKHKQGNVGAAYFCKHD